MFKENENSIYVSPNVKVVEVKTATVLCQSQETNNFTISDYSEEEL